MNKSKQHRINNELLVLNLVAVQADDFSNTATSPSPGHCLQLYETPVIIDVIFYGSICCQRSATQA
jgi:hypothetical protein